MNRITRLLVAVLLVISAVLMGASWYFTQSMVAPESDPCDKAHFIYCGDPEQSFGLSFKEVTFKSRDNLTLGGWVIPGNTKKSILLVHGHTADRHEGLRWVKALHNAGFTLLLIDMRNHGVSDRSAGGMGLLEKNDVLGAVDYLVDEMQSESVGVFGASMGASASIPAMASDERIGAGIFEASFTRLDTLIAELGKRDFGLPRFPLIHTIMLVYRMRAGIDPYDIAPVEHIGKISPRPVMIIHCPDDDYIPFTHGQSMYEHAGQPKEKWWAPCSVHAEAWQGAPEVAEEKVVSFYRRYL